MRLLLLYSHMTKNETRNNWHVILRGEYQFGFRTANEAKDWVRGMKCTEAPFKKLFAGSYYLPAHSATVCNTETLKDDYPELAEA